jgi:rhamnosyltransferase
LSKFHVKILMATHNGMPWLVNQLDSVLAQIDVDVALYVSDDASTDGTFEYLKHIAQKDFRLILLDSKRIGSAGSNFYRLIKEVGLEDDCDYVAFSDQDDVWEPDKLARHIGLMRKYQADGISSNVIAFWPSGKEKLIVKSQPQKKLDYLFESAGPGCTFLMKPWLVREVKKLLVDSSSTANQVTLHDWLVYAVCRAFGKKWLVDHKPSVMYRQHDSNVVGANVGLKAKWSRILKIKTHWYRGEILKVAEVCQKVRYDEKVRELIELLESKSFFARINLLAFVPQIRRSALDRLVLGCAIILGVF